MLKNTPQVLIVNSVAWTMEVLEELTEPEYAMFISWSLHVVWEVSA